MKILKWSLILVFLVNVSACSTSPVASVLNNNPLQSSGSPQGGSSLDQARQKIKHVIIIMQENRSFDNYFGTYPGADGLPRQNGKFTVCVNDPQTGKCVYPFHDPADRNYGGPHGTGDSKADIDGGKMDGFIQQAEKSKTGCQQTQAPDCGGEGTTEVMGY